ncbi:SDR family NAD(P)-dependent oxidoreductase [Desulfosporosinus sp. BICA1-9]|uniref:SDR family NAD(P)-dependent oxidoreductase n=1 Tax=Desulfosporosinus sp. BICA1-9 TaxID=1531958 RepID=UPI00054B8108|nr:glucose 1-dehydrogenase [Desulfosporosinus sp. BICA1-9]KJS46543.1 MAG: 3-ketoacyl-ACP reductase [Peptococcaceae bacterium BRH_c23]KJS78994.1 MAG: 3-ketoacyl-ACP reductase [Desulfosporosinus sp. BICA1-9]HBW34321.1 3-oxoacyl-ACP reductase [Desulfosporosinus sp.]
MLNDKTALITGGGTGIGKAIALKLAQSGVNIAINYSRSEQEALKTSQEIKDLGVRCLIYKADVARDAEIRAMISQVTLDFGKLDILVNNAGTTHFVDHSDLEGMKEEYWDDILGVNVKGLFFCCRAASAELKKSRGCIVNITSIAGLTGLGSSIAYSASKAAAISVTKSLARVLAPEVRVNGVAPGIVQTRWVEGKEEHISRLAAGTPLGRIADPEDIAEVVYSLVAHAGFMTGQTVVVDGGSFI